MVTYYMALGRLTSSFAKGRVPEVKHQNKTYELSIPDFIIWTSLCWNIYNYDELKKVFDAKCKENKFLPDFNFDYYLQSLELRGLIKSGKGCTSIAALYSLMLDLHIRPISNSIVVRTIVFIKLLLNGETFTEAKKAFDKSIFDRDDVCRIWDITSQTDLSVAEVICCVKNNIKDITEDNIIEKVYGEKYDYKTLGAYAQMQDDKYTIINSIVDLYLGKMILFEK